MSELEWGAAALVLINVALVARRSVWNYPFALAAVSLYAIVFYDARLYSDMLLQGFFFALNLYGWTNWLRARGDSGVPVGVMTTRDRGLWACATVAAWLVWSFAMHRFTDAAAPWADGAIAMASIAAQSSGLAKRIITTLLHTNYCYDSIQKKPCQFVANGKTLYKSAEKSRTQRVLLS